MKSPENLNSKWNEFAPKPKQIFESNLKSPFLILMDMRKNKKDECDLEIKKCSSRFHNFTFVPNAVFDFLEVMFWIRFC